MSIDGLQRNAPLSPAEAGQFSPTALAFLGDSVYECLVREQLLYEANRPAGELHRAAVRRVCAEYQSAAAERISEMLTDAERDILRRGRNATGISIPKHAQAAEYRRATGFECLFGYLYLCGETRRLHTIFAAVWSAEEE